MTGLIYVAIIAVWAVVLVPAWLRRHDHLDPERSVDRFSKDMHTLGNGPSVLGIPLPVDQPAHASHEEQPAPEVFRITRPSVLSNASARSGAAAISGATARVGGAAAQAGVRVRRTSAASRRRIVLAALTGVLLLVTGLVVVGVLLPIAIAAPVALLAAFVGAARHQVRSTRTRRSARVSRVPVPAPTAAAPAARRPAPGASGATWEARATPLPSYVTAPPASEFPRVIDTATPGAWTAAAMLERAQQEKARAERMAKAKAEAIAKAKAEQAAADSRTRDEEFLAAQSAAWEQRAAESSAYRRRAVNE